MISTRGTNHALLKSVLCTLLQTLQKLELVNKFDNETYVT